MKCVIVACLLLAMVGCKSKEFRDVSAEASLSHFIGTTYKSKRELVICSIAKDIGYPKIADYYTVMEPPGIGGPEVLSLQVLPADTLMKIIRVERCNNCPPFLTEQRWVVDVLSNRTFKDHPVVIDAGRIDIEKTNALVKVEAGT
ncbi:MAG: hypothetical protein PHU23_18005 [Dehalococcoidales bacterium]|nr:hypothetical protein [Dehalococcoidales bacterium]